ERGERESSVLTRKSRQATGGQVVRAAARAKSEPWVKRRACLCLSVGVVRYFSLALDGNGRQALSLRNYTVLVRVISRTRSCLLRHASAPSVPVCACLNRSAVLVPRPAFGVVGEWEALSFRRYTVTPSF
ncbi:Highly reducing polyketide synthase, partial [Frankliniella fusca]